MIHKDHNYSVNIRAGINGPILDEYDSERSRTTRSIEAITETVLCTQITLHKNFEWFDADGLFVGIRYGSRDYQIELWIPKPRTPQTDDEDDLSFQIPGKNILDAATKKTTGCQYRFADLEVSDLCLESLENHIPHICGQVKSSQSLNRRIIIAVAGDLSIHDDAQTANMRDRLINATICLERIVLTLSMSTSKILELYGSALGEGRSKMVLHLPLLKTIKLQSHL